MLAVLVVPRRWLQGLGKIQCNRGVGKNLCKLGQECLPRMRAPYSPTTPHLSPTPAPTPLTQQHCAGQQGAEGGPGPAAGSRERGQGAAPPGGRLRLCAGVSLVGGLCFARQSWSAARRPLSAGPAAGAQGCEQEPALLGCEQQPALLLLPCCCSPALCSYSCLETCCVAAACCWLAPQTGVRHSACAPGSESRFLLRVRLQRHDAGPEEGG